MKWENLFVLSWKIFNFPEIRINYEPVQPFGFSHCYIYFTIQLQRFGARNQGKGY